MKEIFYFWIRYTSRFSMYAFFSKVELVGTDRIPRGKPLLFAPNHQNAFLDAFVVGGMSPVAIHYLTRADVFNKKFLWLLEGLHMMPIYRMRDGFGKLSQNAGVFEACQKLFSKGKSVLIFPEGSHGEPYYLRGLTKGTSRLAFESQEALGDDKELWIQPVGLNYFDQRKPRRKAMFVFGEPIRVNDYMEQYQTQKAKALIQLRDTVKNHLSDCMIIPEEDEHYEEKVAALNKANEKYSFQELKEKLSKNELKAPERKPRPIFKKIGQLLGLVNIPPLLLMKYILSKKIKDVVFTSSIKWAVGLFGFPIWWLIVFGAVSMAVGNQIAGIVIASMIVLLFLRQEFIKIGEG